MRNVAVLTLSFAAFILTIVAVAVNSTTLFYMGTAMMGTLFVCRLQAWVSVRGLRFERLSPPTVSAGELVTVELAVWSEHPIRRPLVSVIDGLPEALRVEDLTPSLPVAPVHNAAVRTQYQFRPLGRGRFRWNSLAVSGSDALGLAQTMKHYRTGDAELVVLPTPIPVNIQVPRSSGWGPTESEYGKSRGAGIEPRGVREYASSDSLRFVHWRSTARAGRLLVKEFETGAFGQVAFVLQRTNDSEIGSPGDSSLDQACGHVAYIARELLKQGTEVALPTLMPNRPGGSIHVRYQAILGALADVKANQTSTVGEEILASRRVLAPGTTVYATLSTADETLPTAAASLQAAGISIVALLYDPLHFRRTRALVRGKSPVDPDYMARLRVAGIKAVVMPARGDS